MSIRSVYGSPSHAGAVKSYKFVYRVEFREGKWDFVRNMGSEKWEVSRFGFFP
jgi:hypothetical protein